LYVLITILENFTVALDRNRLIQAQINQIQVKRHSYRNIPLAEFLKKLSNLLRHRDPKTMNIKSWKEHAPHGKKDFHPEKGKKITLSRFFDRMANFIPENSIVLADIGTSVFCSSLAAMPKNTTYISQIFYGSMGYTLPAALGASIAAPDRHIIVFVGDGSFQVTCQELSTLIRNKCKPIVFLVNNDGYTIERAFHDNVYNDIQDWKYHLIPEVFGGEHGENCYDEEQLENSLLKAQRVSKERLSFIEFHTDRFDFPEQMKQYSKQT